MLIEFWLLFVHTLRGQYDDLQGSADVLWQRKVTFKKRWQGLHLFSDTTSGLRWKYAIPSSSPFPRKIHLSILLEKCTYRKHKETFHLTSIVIQKLIPTSDQTDAIPSFLLHRS